MTGRVAGARPVHGRLHVVHDHVQNTPSSTDSQWTLTDAGNGYYKLKNLNSGLNAGVAQSFTSNGAAVIQWNDVNVDDQLWKIVRIN